MKSESQFRFAAILLAVLTVTAAIFAFINFQKEREVETATDGVWWVEHEGWLRAERIEAGGPADKGGIKVGDTLTAINGRTVSSVAAVQRQIYRTGIYKDSTYSLVRNEVPVDVKVILEPTDRSVNSGLRLIALIYLGIGLYVLLRRWTAPKSMHFYVFCLVSFVFYSFKYTGKLNAFDEMIYWSNVVAWLLQPALFLHFSLTFPEDKPLVRRHRWTIVAAYVPAVVLLALHVAALLVLAPSAVLMWNLDRLAMLYLALYFVAAAFVFWNTYTKADTPLLRQQMKWVTRGTILAIAPFTALYVIPFLIGNLPTGLQKVSVLSLVFLPLTFGYAIVRYRLMDVDIIFKRGMTYTLAAAAIVGMFYGAVAVVATLAQKAFPSTGPAGLVAAVIVTALLFEPIKNFTQQKLIDPLFYRKRYDYRRTLIEFGRELNSVTDLAKMLTMVIDRLSRTLLVDKLAVFLEDDGHFYMARSFGIGNVGALDLGFLATHQEEFATGHLFYDNTRLVPRETPTEQETIAKLDLNYYIPCTIQNRVIAVLGLGKTMEGDFLSSEDVELLETLAGYIGIAIQNAVLYASLEQKVSEYERLKEFNENIVESISVGVLAVDLEDRIESWNSQMEVMYAMPRVEVLGKPLSEVFPAAFNEEFYRVRQNAGIHNLYKFRLQTPAGDARVTNVAIAPLVTKKFHVIGRLIIVDDITERIGLESQLTQAEKMSSIGLLAAGVAHEVNTPLAVISSYAQMLAKQVAGDEKKSSLLEKITAQTFRASEIVNNLLNFSRTSGTEFSDISLNKVIGDTLSLLDHQMKVAKVKVVHELAEDLPLIHGNAGKLQQVFLNLFLNAKDAMPHGGTLTVSTANGSGVNVAIKDTGTGIEPENLRRIYDPFFTTKNNVREGERRGTGLGLAVSYGIIQEHAGKIHVESEPGKGTTFYLEFPMVRKAVGV
ncbi:MAG TPA: ATP-binding protein [Terriglobales bacterium]|jgi:PAS domain S-box-containing protein|nr:ATP-binding protein [Terriglobales bacterium]